MKRARIVIVGGGIVGAAVFQRLARLHGPEVLLIEKSRPGHGATAYSGGIVRAFHLDPLLAERCAEGLRHYRNLTRNTAGEFRIHRTGFLQYDMGYASAMAWVQLLIILGLTGIAFWSSRRWVHYQGK